MTDDDRPETSLSGTSVVAQHIIVRDMVLACTIGVTAEERQRRQRLRVSFELALDRKPPQNDRLDETVNYGLLVRRARELCQTCNCELLETLAERLAAAFFAEPDIQYSRIRIEKLDRYADVGSVGVEIERRRDGP